MKIFWRTFFRKRDRDKDKFPFGIRFYEAYMGEGKSLSSVFDAFQLAYEFPDLLLFSNLKIKDYPAKQVNFSTKEELEKFLLLIDDDKINYKHILILIDEALPYFSENQGLSVGTISALTNLRKNRVCMFLNSQKFVRVNNRIRDFSKETVKCSTLFGIFQYNQVRDDKKLVWSKEDVDYVGTKKYSYIFKRHNRLYNSYDTLAKIKTSRTKDEPLLTVAAAPPPPQPIKKSNNKK